MEYKKGCTITNPVLRNPFYSISYFSSYWKVGILNLYNNPPTMEATRSGLPCSEPSYVSVRIPTLGSAYRYKEEATFSFTCTPAPDPALLGTYRNGVPVRP